MESLELRMYGLVPYNISPIQQGIQFGHAVVEYGQKMKKNGNVHQYDEWADKWKTFIILNGGTTNHRFDIESGLPFGTLNNHVLTLLDNQVEFATFNEPDLGDQLTSVVFIVDERVFNKRKYPDFSEWLLSNFGDLINDDYGHNLFQISEKVKSSTEPQDKKAYADWLKFIGGKKNEFLREFLRNFKLA